MNLFNTFDPHQSSMVGFGIRSLLISDLGGSSPLMQRLAGLGCRVEVVQDIYSALDWVADGPDELQLIVIDCDFAGGLALGQRAHALLRATGRCIPMILISREISEQQFPFSRYEPTILRAPFSSVALRVGFEHALQEQLIFTRAG